MYSERTNGFDAKIIAENKRIPLLGLTGSMAAGKSTVSAMLAERGFFIVDADKTAHDVIQTEKVLRKLTDAFGEGILDESGNIDRKKLSVCVFGEKKNEVQDKTCPGNAANASAERIAAEKKSRVELLNDIVHPAVIESLLEQAETAKQRPDCPGVVLDVPLLIESGLHKRCDSVILVTANIETRYARIMKRDGLSRREARARIAAQMPQWKKKRYAEYRIGKLYAAGLGCEQDYGDAARWFQLSADKGYKYAEYSLAGLFCRGQGVEQDDARALELYTASAQQDFPYAAYELGKMYRDGIGCEKDAEASEQWYRQAFAGFLELEQQSHDNKLQYRIGWMRLHGVGTGKDEAAARTWFEQASKLDNPHAQYQLARMIFNDPSSTPEQTAQALERLTKAAEAGQDCAQYALGKIYRDGQGVEKDIQKAVALFTLAATKENSFAAFALGKLYLAGDAALPRDPAAALKWLTYAAELGNQFAQYRLGKLLLKGDDGIPKDVITAIRWLTAAAKQENGYAEYALALVYLTGEDAPKDSVKALSLLKRSAGRGNQFAQYRLGKLLLQGEDAPKDVKAAIRWLTAAAEQGNQYAQYALGKLYLLEKNVPKDRSSAIKWFQLAADQGNEYAQYFLEHMDDRLGQPPVAAVISLFHHLANIFQEQNQPPPSGGVRVAVDRKLLRKIKAKKIAQGHKADDHEPEMQL